MKVRPNRRPDVIPLAGPWMGGRPSPPDPVSSRLPLRSAERRNRARRVFQAPAGGGVSVGVHRGGGVAYVDERGAQRHLVPRSLGCHVWCCWQNPNVSERGARLAGGSSTYDFGPVQKPRVRSPVGWEPVQPRELRHVLDALFLVGRCRPIQAGH
ncbi:uncharacterized protein LOC143655658 isoform X2 [Tamandua tetradactyla]|uniref:uncharacterized protein LOC143655658 isoform X2 n=1 Tax=Tamandua tetradactyla TaxID=48850 RepID=UPI004054964F